jgi:hypothetical protein
MPVLSSRGEKIGDGGEQPKGRRVDRSAVEREVAGVLHHTRRRQGGVAGVDPRAASVLRVNLGEGALVVEGALDGALPVRLGDENCFTMLVRS